MQLFVLLFTIVLHAAGRAAGSIGGAVPYVLYLYEVWHGRRIPLPMCANRKIL